MIIITGDSSNDLSKELIKKNDIRILPFNILMNDKEYLDGINITSQMIIDNFNENGTLPKTSAVSIESFREFFSENLKNEDDKIIHFSLSGEMSCSYENAVKASAEFDGRVKIIDSRSLSTGVGLLMLYACDERDAGFSFEEIIERVEKRIPYVQASFVIKKLNFLHKGGRCSSLQLLGANLFNIKPSIEVHNGKMGMSKKYRGPYIKVIESYVKDILQKYNNPDLTRCFITFSTIDDDVLKMVEDTLKENANFKEILVTNAGATITSHCGANTIGILYINDGGKDGYSN